LAQKMKPIELPQMETGSLDVAD